MYDKYLKYNNIPFGAILDRIRTKENLSQRELALRSGIPYQRINDFIANRRRISPENSLRLEKVLGIDFQCFFYQAQTNYDIYMATKQHLEQPSPDKSKYTKHRRQRLFKADIRIEKEFERTDFYQSIVKKLGFRLKQGKNAQ